MVQLIPSCVRARPLFVGGIYPRRAVEGFLGPLPVLHVKLPRLVGKLLRDVHRLWALVVKRIRLVEAKIFRRLHQVVMEGAVPPAGIASVSWACCC